MEVNPRIVRKRRRKKKSPFFSRKSKFFEVRYWEVGIFFLLLLYILIGLFHRVFYDYISSFWS